jgi:glycosyltransferase involved in cell wall biosynthesis
MNENLNKPAVSIGMPVYNGERYIAEAINSILNQTFENFELIISDNASTDGTELICIEFAKNDNRIRYVRQPFNMGSLSNFRFVLEQAQAPFFMWAACDDVWSPNWLEVLLKNFTDQDAGVFGAYYEGNSFELKVPQSFAASSFIRFFMASDQTGKCYYSYALYKTSYLRKADFSLMASRIGGDQTFLLSMLTFGSLRACSGPQFYYRVHDESVSACQSRSYGRMRRLVFSKYPLDYYRLSIRAVPWPNKIYIFLAVPIKYLVEQSASWKDLFFLLARKLARVFRDMRKESGCR